MLGTTEALRPSELFALRCRSSDDQNTLPVTETVYRRTLRPFGKTPGSLTKVHLPDGLADELFRWKMECKQVSCKTPSCQKEAHRKSSPDAFIFPNADGGFVDADNYRFRVLKPLTEALAVPKVNFQGHAPNDGDAGPEDGIGEEHSGAPAAFEAGHDGQ